MGPKSVSALRQSFYTKTSSSRVIEKVSPIECRYLEHWSCYIIDVDNDIIYWILIKSALNLIFEMLLKTFSRYIRGFIFFVSSFLLCIFVIFVILLFFIFPRYIQYFYTPLYVYFAGWKSSIYSKQLDYWHYNSDKKQDSKKEWIHFCIWQVD